MIVIRSPWELERLTVSGRVVAEILQAVKERLVPGVSTQELDELAHRHCLKKKVLPAFKGYHGYPYSLCVSVNEEVVHGFPSGRKLSDGDIVSIDFGVCCEGYYGDAALTVAIGAVSPVAEKLIRVTREALFMGWSGLRPAIGWGMSRRPFRPTWKTRGFPWSVTLWGTASERPCMKIPQIPNFGTAGKGPVLKPGMVLAIEPMVNAGGSEVEILSDGWTAVTKDRSLSAHFEHTVAVTENGCRILSESGSQNRLF